MTQTDAQMPTDANAIPGMEHNLETNAESLADIAEAAARAFLGYGLSGRPVLLIGSGADLDGRKLGAAIDAGNYGAVARVNRPYGAAADAGSRADIVFVRRRLWLNWHFRRSALAPGARIIAFREGVGCPPGYESEVAARLGLPRCSTGLLAAQWLLDAGAKVSAIGFGCKDGVFAESKRYAVTGAADANAAYDWATENAWLKENVCLL